MPPDIRPGGASEDHKWTYPQDVVPIARTVHQLLARPHALALVDVHVHAARQIACRARAEQIPHFGARPSDQTSGSSRASSSD